MLKKNKLRYNEYYDMQHIYDELYAQSKNGNNFYKEAVKNLVSLESESF